MVTSAQGRAVTFGEGSPTGAVAHSGAGGRELEKKYLDFSLLAPLCLLPRVSHWPGPAKTREQQRLVMEPMGPLSGDLQRKGRVGAWWVRGHVQDKTQVQTSSLACSSRSSEPKAKACLVSNTFRSPRSSGPQLPRPFSRSAFRSQQAPLGDVPSSHLCLTFNTQGRPEIPDASTFQSSPRGPKGPELGLCPSSLSPPVPIFICTSGELLEASGCVSNLFLVIRGSALNTVTFPQGSCHLHFASRFVLAGHN